MDAKITKQRLGNLLSYDWLKILVAIAVAVTALTVFFTMVRTRPTGAQTYTVYGYSGLQRGNDFLSLEDSIEDVFSYDILKVNADSFDGNRYQEMAFTARRAAGEGTVMFVSDYVLDDGNEETKEMSDLSLLAQNYLSDRAGDEANSLLLDTKKYLADAESYLQKYFGENWREGTLDEAAARATFDKRNGKDKRFRYRKSKYEQGVVQEYARLNKLREDYLFVLKAFEENKLSHTEYTADDGQTYSVGICLGALNIRNLFYYTVDGVQSGEKVNLIVFNNGERMGDLKFETFSFLRYLVERY